MRPRPHILHDADLLNPTTTIMLNFSIFMIPFNVTLLFPMASCGTQYFFPFLQALSFSCQLGIEDEI